MWPALRARNSRRAICSARLEVIPSGLSSTRIPVTARRGRRGSVTILFVTIPGHRLIDQAGQMDTAADALVMREMQRRDLADTHAAAQAGCG